MEALVVGGGDDGLAVDGGEGDGEVGGPALGLDSCEEEVLQGPAADSHLRLGLVEQRGRDPASSVERSDLDTLMTPSMLARPT